MRECVDEGMVQAFVDGELSPQMAERVATHAASCAACSLAVSEAENELTLLTAAFAPEMSLPVPSERLRERLDVSINELRAQRVAPEKATWNLKSWLAALVPSFNFAPRHAVGFASLVAVVAFAAIFVVALRQNGNQSSLAVATNSQHLPDLKDLSIGGPQSPKPPIFSYTSGSSPINYPNKPHRTGTTAGKSKQPVPEAKPLPGEQTYLNTIASLSTIIENNGDSALKPSLRSDYERNLALVDQAINSTRQTARKNPKDSDAAEFLYSSYQSKIELLSTVAEQGQMLAVAR